MQLYETFLKHPIVSTDTRKLPHGCIFFALKGENFNANKFAAQALESGAAYAVVDEKEYAVNDKYILVDDVLTALQQLASHHRKMLSIPVLGLTGSNGKTTTKELIAAVLSKKFNTHFTSGNLNNHIGVPLTLLGLKKEHQFAVIEMGANHQKEIEALCRIADPNFGLVTNIGKAHLEGFGGTEGVKKGKGELYEYIKSKEGLLFLNGDDAVIAEVAGAYNHVYTYGRSAFNQVSGGIAGEGEFLTVKCNAPFERTIKTQLTGHYNFSNVMAAVAIGNYFEVPPDLIKEAIENYAPSNQRSQIIYKPGNVTVILDAYNANPSSVMAALDNLEHAFKGDKIVALGDMLELGEESHREHALIGERLAGMHLQKVILVGPEFKSDADRFSFQHFNNSTEAAQWFKEQNFHDCTILIKGSRGMKMEAIAEGIVSGQ